MNGNEKTTISDITTDGVRIITYCDGSQEFHAIMDYKKDKPKEDDDIGFFGRIKKWYDGLFIKPYVKVRDLADPFGDRDDPDKGQDGKNGVEVGIRIDF